jgi:hypothetical protein
MGNIVGSSAGIELVNSENVSSQAANGLVAE